MNTELSPDFLQKLFNKIDTLTDIVSEQTATINKLTETIKKQEIEIAELKEKLNKNSKNCSSFGKCSKSCVVAEKRYEVDVVVQTKVILHQVMSIE